MTSIVPMTQEDFRVMLQNDTAQLRTFLNWLTDRVQAYQQNATADNLTAAGYDANQQALIQAFAGDLNRLKMLSGGTLPSDATDMRYTLTAIIGIY